LILTLAAPSASSAAPATIQITGKVLDLDGSTPVRDVIIKVRNRTSGQEYESRPSGQNGQYRIPGVPDGEYTIVIRTGTGEFELPNRVVIQGGQPSAITVILTAAASASVREGDVMPEPRRRRVAVLIPIMGGILVSAFAAKEIFEKDGDASPKLP
jgi:hypothetical protein